MFHFLMQIYIKNNFCSGCSKCTTLKEILDIFTPSDLQWLYLSQIWSYPNTPYVNVKLIYSAFRWCINLSFKNVTLVTGFLVQGRSVCVIFYL